MLFADGQTGPVVGAAEYDVAAAEVVVELVLLDELLLLLGSEVPPEILRAPLMFWLTLGAMMVFFM